MGRQGTMLSQYPVVQAGCTGGCRRWHEERGREWLAVEDTRRELVKATGKQPAHLILRLIISCFGGILVPSISPHWLRSGGHSRGCRVGGLLHSRRAGLLYLLRLSRGLVFLHSIHYCNYLGFLLSLEKWGQEVTLTARPFDIWRLFNPSEVWREQLFLYQPKQLTRERRPAEAGRPTQLSSLPPGKLPLCHAPILWPSDTGSHIAQPGLKCSCS